ncbi:MAG: 6-hydroxymethylpterin diphosphokinase MptE-like protein [Treponemataceae bacterium]
MEANNETEKPCLVKAKQDFSVYYKSKFLYSKYSPKALIEKTVESRDILCDSLVLIFSPVLFYGMERLTEKLNEDSFVLAIETDKNIYNFSLECDESQFKNFKAGKKNFEYLYIPDYSEIQKLFCNKNFLKKISKCKRMISFDFCTNHLDETQKKLQENIKNFSSSFIAQFWKNRITLVKLGKLFNKNIFLNLKLIQNSVKLNPHSVLKPILVLGAGPSVDIFFDNLESKLKNYKTILQNNFFLLCVDSVLKSVKNRNITPDAVIAVESQLANEKAFIGQSNTKTILISDFTSQNNINRYMKANKNTKLSFIFTEYDSLNFLENLKKNFPDIPVFPPLGSVGLYALEIAIYLRHENTPIFFSGLDFSYEDSKTHCRECPAIFNGLISSNRTKSILNCSPNFKVGSKKIAENLYTNRILENYAMDFISRYSKTKNLFNLSKIKLGNILNMETNEFINFIDYASPKTFPKKKQNCKNLCNLIDTNTDLSSYSEKYLKFITKEKKELTKIRDYLSNGNIDAEQLVQLIDLHEYLFIHFPDGNGGCKNNISFFKRVRNEIDFFLKQMK